jgi:flagellar biosynthetic protein FliP
VIGTLLASSAAAGAVDLLDLDGLTGPAGLSTVMKIALVLTVLSVLPSVLMMFTCFIRLIVVFHFLRQAMGTQTLPPNQVLSGLALMLTLFVMTPVGQEIYERSVLPYQRGELSGEAALDRGLAPLKSWMLRNTREADVRLFVSLAKVERPPTREDVPLRVVVPAFLISELKTAFQIGFLLFMPFLVIDLIVSSVLLSMGMMMLPPVIVSFPFKILLFVMVDGWHLLVGSLVASIR